MARPIVFLAFANQEQEPYLDLSTEDDGIYNLFVTNDQTQTFQIHRDQYTSSDELINFIQSFQNKISIFHFGGHAGDSQLQLSNLSAQQKGLAALLGKQKNLRVVFLNGCNTYSLVEQLLKEKVPVVIATNRKIGNDEAVQLALHFYTKLTTGSSIKEAFEAACDAVHTTSDRDIVVRDLVSSPSPEAEPEDDGAFPWGIYYNDEKALNWKLKQAVADVQNVSNYFWVRLVFLILAVFIFFLWTNRHFGTSSTTFFLANGPLALLGIATFFMQRLKGKYPGISSVSDNLSTFFLKTPVLIAIGLVLGAIMLMGTSVVVKNTEQSPLKLSVTDQKAEPIQHWEIESGNEKKSRLFMLASPFSDSVRLNIEGYQPTNIDPKHILGNRMDIEEFQVQASLLVRLQLQDMRLAPRITIKIDCPSTDPILVQPGDKVSVLVGPQQSIAEPLLQEWKKELTNLGLSNDDYINKFVTKWSDPNLFFEGHTFTPGDKVVISKILNDSVYFKKEVIIDNQRINDVLLQI